MTYVVTCTASKDVFLLSKKGSREAIATVRGTRELAEAMAAGAALQGRQTSVLEDMEAAIAAHHSNEARAEAALGVLMEYVA